MFNDIAVHVQPGYRQSPFHLKPVHIAERERLKPARSRERRARQGLQVKKCSAKNSPGETRSAAPCWNLNVMQASKQFYTWPAGGRAALRLCESPTVVHTLDMCDAY